LLLLFQYNCKWIRPQSILVFFSRYLKNGDNYLGNNRSLQLLFRKRNNRSQLSKIVMILNYVVVHIVYGVYNLGMVFFAHRSICLWSRIEFLMPNELHDHNWPSKSIIISSFRTNWKVNSPRTSGNHIIIMDQFGV
jgi:hypothetical protein